jgi:hypothetical protein
MAHFARIHSRSEEDNLGYNLPIDCLELMKGKKQKIIQGRTHPTESIAAIHSDGDTTMK